MRRTARSAIVLAALWMGGGQAAADQFTYENQRFGTSATFPDELFSRPLPDPSEEDGRGWASEDGADIFVYARSNNGGETPGTIVGTRDAVDDVTYSRTGRRWAVVSGYRDGRIFYERYIFRGDVIHSVSIRYPRTLRRTYDPIAGPVTLTLRGPGQAS